MQIKNFQNLMDQARILKANSKKLGKACCPGLCYWVLCSIG